MAYIHESRGYPVGILADSSKFRLTLSLLTNKSTALEPDTSADKLSQNVNSYTNPSRRSFGIEPEERHYNTEPKRHPRRGSRARGKADRRSFPANRIEARAIGGVRAARAEERLEQEGG